MNAKHDLAGQVGRDRRAKRLLYLRTTPTRRVFLHGGGLSGGRRGHPSFRTHAGSSHGFLDRVSRRLLLGTDRHHAAVRRSEAHTSELQALMRITYVVFCLSYKTTPSSSHL